MQVNSQLRGVIELKKKIFSGLILLGLLLALTACDTGSLPTNSAASNPGSTTAPANNSNSNNPNLNPDTPAARPSPTPNRGGNSGDGNQVVNNPGGDLPRLANKPQLVAGNFQGCPAQGDGGDPELNMHKNRTDTAAWYPVAVSKIVNLPWPNGIGGQKRSNWSASQRAEVAQYEGIPIQLEGWLAGAKAQGPESCNCHSTDEVDYHLWIVDDPAKDRSQSVVVEMTPRVRAFHPGWSIERVQPLVDGKTKVRISGWLMMDQEHPDQIGKTRGTIWEIHPIMAVDVLRGSNWVPLDTGRVVSSASGSGTVNKNPPLPTQYANLPPTENESEEEATLPTPTPRPPSGRSQGRASSKGGITIADIAYNGASGRNEPDEFVEITNKGNNPVNMNGWVLRDVYGGEEFTWHNFTLQPGQTVRVYTNEVHPETGGFSFGSKTAIWRNSGDAAELLDASGMVESSFAYGDKR